MDGSTRNVSVNEIDCALQAGDGKKNPTDAGLRMDNTKYMLTYFDDETGVAQLARRGGGGAAICKTATGVIIALFEKEGVDSNGKSQNIADVSAQVSAMATYLKEQGFWTIWKEKTLEPYPLTPLKHRQIQPINFWKQVRPHIQVPPAIYFVL